MKGNNVMKKSRITLEVLNPRGEIPPPPVFGLAPRIADFSGKKIGLIDNRKAGANFLLDAVEELLKKKFPNATILRFRKPDAVIVATPKFYPMVAEQCDTFIWAIGD
jgi:hypothetical protein